jgi:hypothetical protein
VGLGTLALWPGRACAPLGGAFPVSLVECRVDVARGWSCALLRRTGALWLRHGREHHDSDQG